MASVGARLSTNHRHNVPASITFPDSNVSPDGHRFLMLKLIEQEQAAPTQINVVLNWFEGLKRRVPTKQ